MPFSELLSSVDATAIIDSPATSELTPHVLSDSTEFFYYLRGYDTQDEFFAENSYQELSGSWRYLAVDGTPVSSVMFVYDKPAFGYTVAAASYIVRIAGVSSRLDLPATTTRAEFETNCRTLVAWCATMSYDRKPRFIGQAAWGRTGVVGTILAPRITDSFVVRGPSMWSVLPSHHAGLVVRNAFGPKVLWQNRDLPRNRQVLLTDEAALEAEASAQAAEGEAQPVRDLPIDTISARSSKVYQYLKTVRYGGTKGEAKTMPWASIITFILSFVLSKKSGKSTAAAALTGLAVGGATYLLADPANPDNLFGIGVNGDSKAPGTTPPATTTPSGSTGAASLGQAIGGAINGAGKAISNMGPGTAALVGGAAGLTLAGKANWLLWGGLAIGAFLLLKD